MWLRLIANQCDNFAILVNLPLCFRGRKEFSAGGLSGDIFRMQLSEMRVYKDIYKLGLINFLELLSCILFSNLKFLRRFLIRFFNLLSN